MADKTPTRDPKSTQKEPAAAVAGPPGTPAAAAPQGGKKKKKKSKEKAAAGPQVLWTTRLAEKWNAWLLEVKEIGRGLRSPDLPTRRMSRIYFVSLAGALIVVGIASERFYQARRARVNAERAELEQKMNAFFAKQAEEARRRGTSLPLGTFTLELKPTEYQKDVPGVMNMAELELVAQCDIRDTCSYLEEHIAQVRNQVTNIFTAIDRDELLSKEGKKKIKKALLERLNTWLPKGKIEEIYFSKLVIS